MARDYKGGKCIVCGYNKSQRALSFHHVDPKKKSFTLSERGLTRSWELIKKEIDKCVLLCANCHMEIHDGITQLPAERQVEKRSELGEILTKKIRGQSRAKLRVKSEKV